MTNRFPKKLQQLEAQGRYRSLSLPGGIDLSSNDYLGLRSHSALRKAAIEAVESGVDMGSGGSRLLRGHTEHHENLEFFAAKFFGCEKTLYFSTGYQANAAIFSALPNRHDVIVYDELIHASARDGIQASNAKSIKVPHNDLNGFEQALKRACDSAEQIWIAVESLYSMDGDFAPLKELYALARQYDAILIVDEAHGTGVFGDKGQGLCAELPHENLITLHTCGKALGVAGGMVCASAEIIDTMINTARPFIYSTAPPPLQALLVQKALEIVGNEEGAQRRAHLHQICGYVKTKIEGQGIFSVGWEEQVRPSQIVPLIFGEDQKAVTVAQKLQNSGYDIRAIRPPTVPEGTARLRLSLNVNLTEEILESFFNHLMEHLQGKAA